MIKKIVLTSSVIANGKITYNRSRPSSQHLEDVQRINLNSIVCFVEITHKFVLVMYLYGPDGTTIVTTTIINGIPKI